MDDFPLFSRKRDIEVDERDYTNFRSVLEHIIKLEYRNAVLGQRFTINPYMLHFEQIFNAMERGVITARKIIKTQANFSLAMFNMRRKIVSGTVTSEDDERFVRKLSISLTGEECTFDWSFEHFEMATNIIDRLQSRIPDDEISELDKDVRICYSTLYIKEDSIQIYLAKNTQKYPYEPYFYLIRILFLRYLNLPEAQEVLLEALSRFPNDCNILFVNADMCKEMLVSPVSKIVQAWMDFVREAPPCHKDVPEGYYNISVESPNLRAKRRYLMFGDMAEKCLLPCYKPFKSITKDLASWHVGLYSQHVVTRFYSDFRLNLFVSPHKYSEYLLLFIVLFALPVFFAIVLNL